MGYFDTLAENSFKKTPDGRTVFYPNGAIGKGRIVPDDETRARLHRFQRNNYIISLAIGVGYGGILGISDAFTWTTLFPAAAFIVYLFYKQHTMLRGLEKSRVRLGFREAVAKNAGALPEWYYWIAGISGAFLILLGLFLAYALWDSLAGNVFLVLGVLSFGVLGLAMPIWMYTLRKSTRRLDETGARAAGDRRAPE